MTASVLMLHACISHHLALSPLSARDLKQEQEGRVVRSSYDLHMRVITVPFLDFIYQ
jgi:hypothetical protein